MCEYVIDADIIIAFSKLNKVELLFNLYKGKFLLFDIIKQEIRNDYRKIKAYISEEITLDTQNHAQEIIEFNKIRQNHRIGEGEAMLMAYCKFRSQKVILLSNNYIDINKYCERNGIKYFTLIDILMQLYNKHIINEKEANSIYDFWIQKGIRLPEASFDELKEKYNIKYKKTY